MVSLAQTGTYAPGDMIRAVLRFRWQGEFDAVRVDLERTTFGGAAFGNQIVLRSRSHRRVVDEGEPYTLVVLEGEVPNSVRTGTLGQSTRSGRRAARPAIQWSRKPAAGRERKAMSL
jgi:hypothetical protein